MAEPGHYLQSPGLGFCLSPIELTPFLGAPALPALPHEGEMFIFLLADAFTSLKFFVAQPGNRSFSAPIFYKGFDPLEQITPNDFFVIYF